MTDGRKTWTPEEISLVVSLRNQGHGWRAIARHIGRSDVMCRYQYERHTGEPVKATPRQQAEPVTPRVSDIRAERAPDSPPLPVGHPIVMRALWSGITQRVYCEPKN
ncbi:SANT/Myb-like DNA-binding domain-containing protein [Acetobacter orientalis]|uniref:SANT/Myb-like DNA-binding domain-containing protein n=1 Tax=Acetobacter orientalis TaxID=146474 RepID=UPI0039E9CC33